MTITPAAGSLFKLTFLARSAAGIGYAGLRRFCVVESTTNLSNSNSWQQVVGSSEITGNNLPFDWLETDISAPRKFYRLTVRVK